MKTPNTLTAALAAFAGLSFAVAYAAPSYTPNPNSPINATPLLNSASPLLNTYDDYIKLVDDALTGTDSLLLPSTGGNTFPKAPAFVAAVAKAVHDNPGNTQQIVEAAVQYRGGNYGDKVKDILKAIATADPALAEDAVIGAAAGNPLKVADAAAGAVLGIIVSTAKDTADYGDIVDETVDLSTQALIEKIGKAAVSSAKKAPVDSPIKAVKIAKALTAAVIADGGTLYIDDLARGLVAGAAGITTSSQAEVAAGALDVLDNTAYENTKFIAEFASGALKAVKVGTSFYTSVLNALETTSVVGSSHLSTIQAVDAAHQALRNAASGTEGSTLQTALTAAYINDLEAFMIGAVQNKPSKSGDLVTAMLTDPQVTAAAPSNAVKQAIVGAAVRGKFTNGGKVVAAAIDAGANGLTPTLAVTAAIPNATSDIAGSIAGAAIKETVKLGTSTTSVSSGVGSVGATQADDIASAAVSAAVSAGYGDSINDIALAAVKAKKLDEAAIVQTLVANSDSAGWREAIVAQAVIFDKKNKIALKAAADAGAVTAGSSAFERASLQLTGDLAELAKLQSKTVFDDSVEDFFNGSPIDVGGTPTARSQFAKAILFGRGEVNIKLAGPLLALAMKYNTNPGLTSAQMLAVAKSIYKKGSPALDIQYTVIQDALSTPDALFDLVDHETATNLAKYAPDIAAAATAARPEYAHIIARAGSFRSPSNAGKIGAAAITFGHMKSNRDTAGNPIADPNDPAAVAAISAATILGIKDAKLPTSPTDKETPAVKNAVGALVKAAALLEDDTATFPQYTATGPGLEKAQGSAGAVTGIIAEIQGYGGSSTSSLSTLAGTAITAAIKADKKHSLQIAQAAAQAAQWVYQLNGGVGAISASFRDAILAAVNAGGPLGNVGAAIDFGISEGVANHYGAGAAGILNYAHRSGILPAVTSLENF